MFRCETSDSALICFFFLPYVQVPTNDPYLNGLDFAKIRVLKYVLLQKSLADCANRR